jgi:hypothetical protein
MVSTECGLFLHHSKAKIAYIDPALNRGPSAVVEKKETGHGHQSSNE